MKKTEIRDFLVKTGSIIKQIVTRNIGLKLLSILFAMILWSYIANSSTSFTRTKTITNVPVTINGLSTLNTAGYAISGDLSETLSSVTATVEAPISSIGNLSASNLTVSFDLSTIRKAGTRMVTLHGSSTVGKVVRINPEKIEVEIESLDTRTVPVNPVIVNGSDDYWYSIGKTNPGTITVSGPTSLMQQVASAEIRADVADHTSSFSRAYLITLADEKGEPIKTDNISRSTSSASATIEVYPKKELPVEVNPSKITVPDGYYVADVSFEPASIMVAGDSSLLEDLTTLPTENIVLTDTGTTKTPVMISGLSGFKYISANQVYATVTILEEETTRVMRNISVKAINVPEGMDVTITPGEIGVSVTGPKSRIVELSEDELSAVVDLSGLSAGTYKVEPAMETVEGLSFGSLTESAVTVTIEKAE